MKSLVLQFPKQKTMYNPNKPAIRLETSQSKHIKTSGSRTPTRQSDVVDRLYKKEQIKQQRIQQMKQEQDQTNTPQKITFINKKSQQILETLQLKPFLERQEDLNQEKKMKLELQKLLQQQEEEVLDNIKIMPSRSYSQFLKDSEEWVQYKEYKKQLLKDEINQQNESSFHPIINPKSAIIADKKMKKSGLNLVDQGDRLSMPLRQNFALDKENYTFSPCINQKSRQIANKHKFQRSQSPWNQF